MTTSEELHQARTDYAQALGFLMMRAAEVEYEIRIIATTIFELVAPSRADGVQRGKHQISRVIEDAMDFGPPRLPSEVGPRLRSTLEEARGLLGKRNDFAHSPLLESSIFDENPVQARLVLKKMTVEETPLQEINQLTFDLEDVRRKLMELFNEDIWPGLD